MTRWARRRGAACRERGMNSSRIERVLSVFMNFVQTEHNIAKIGQIVELGGYGEEIPHDSLAS
jgi:hypothetical protein